MTIKVGFINKWKKGTSILEKKVVKYVGDKAHRNFTRSLLRHFSGLVIIVKHRSLDNIRDDAAAFSLTIRTYNLIQNPIRVGGLLFKMRNLEFSLCFCKKVCQMQSRN